jgi:hypothetical protein
MSDNNSIEISLSKTKLTKLLIFSILFLLAGLWIIIANPQNSNPFFNSTAVKTVASYGALIMGIFGIYFFTKKLMDKKPGLVLSDQGIVDNTSAFNFGLIPWVDIAAIYESSIQTGIASKQYFLTIALEDPEKYIARETNFLKRKLLIANSKNYGSPIHISTNGLKTNHQDLCKLANEYFEKFKNKS